MEFLVFLPNLLWPWISKVIFPHRVSVFEILAQLVVVSVVGAAVYYGSIWAGLQDVEILNGFVTGKKKNGYPVNTLIPVTAGMNVLDPETADPVIRSVILAMSIPTTGIGG